MKIFYVSMREQVYTSAAVLAESAADAERIFDRFESQLYMKRDVLDFEVMELADKDSDFLERVTDSVVTSNGEEIDLDEALKLVRGNTNG